MQPIGYRHPFFEGPGMVLREVANLWLVSPLDRTSVELETWLGLVHFDQQGLEQGGLAQAVPAHQTNLFSTHDRSAEIADDLLVTVGFAHVFELQDVLAGRPQQVEPDVRPLNIRPRQLRGLQPLHFFLARRYLARTSAGG